MKRYLILGLLASGLAGCVTSGTFHEQEAATKTQKDRADGLAAQLQSANTQLQNASAELASLKTSDAGVKEKLGATQTQLTSVQTQLASLQTSNKDLQQSLESNKGELTKKVSALVKEKDDLTQKLAEASKKAADLQRQLDAAQQANKALEQAKQEEIAKVKSNYEQLTSGLKSEIAAGEVTITQLKGKLTVNMVDRILFDSGQAEIKSDGKNVLEKVAKVLNGVADKDIRIEGHTDNKPIVGDLRNKYPTNWELSTARATAVARYLEDQAKIDPKRLIAAGFGEYHPVAANDTSENRALNRRIEIVLVPKE